MSTCVAQPIVGKLSDILGRKDALLGSYILFAIGSTICGVGQTMWQVITGRLIAGLGGAGMTVLVSVVITDLVPMSDVAPWRSYVNVVATTGRMAGGPLGGFLTDSLGWRWSFLGQVPLTLIALASISLKLRSSEVQESDATPPNSNTRSKIGRIDFIGATLLSITIISLLFAIDLLGRGASWNSPFITGTSVGFIAFSTIFFIYEAYYAIEPIWTLRLLLVRNVAATYWINILHAGAQVGVRMQTLSRCPVLTCPAHVLRTALFPSNPRSVQFGRRREHDPSIHREHHWCTSSRILHQSKWPL